VTFKNSGALREIAKSVPVDRFWSKPMRLISRAAIPRQAQRAGLRGRSRQSAAEVRGITLEEISRQTSENFFKLFAKVPRAAAAAHDAHVYHSGVRIVRRVRGPAPAGARAIRPIRRTGGGAARCWSSGGAARM